MYRHPSKFTLEPHSNLGPPSLFNTSASYGAPQRRVPGTDTMLVIYLATNVRIERYALGYTINRSQAKLRSFIEENDANDTSLAAKDNPWTSDPAWKGCYFAVEEYPPGTKLMTYGIVYNVLEGLRLWLFIDRLERKAIVEVRHEQFGPIGMGSISPETMTTEAMGVSEAGVS